MDNDKMVRIMKIIPVIFIVVGVMLCIDGIANMGKGVEVTATIADIRTESGTPGDSDSDDHKVYLNYTYEGEEYKDVYYRVYSDFMYVGKKIKIKIDENDPTKIYYSSDNITMGLFFIVLPLFILLFPAYINLKNRNNSGEDIEEHSKEDTELLE